jgi:thiol-disulfide isomerase/thioredoxin
MLVISFHRLSITFTAAMLAVLAGDVAALGAAAPDCNWKIAGTNQIYDVKQFRGKALYVDFWASWCAPCALSFPFMNQMKGELGDKKLAIVAVNMDEKSADAHRFLESHPANFDVALGENAACAKAFGVSDMPSSYIIDQSGMIRFVHRGFRRDDSALLLEQVESLLKTP